MPNPTPVTPNRGYRKAGAALDTFLDFGLERTSEGFDDVDSDVQALVTSLGNVQTTQGNHSAAITALQASDLTLAAQDKIDFFPEAIALGNITYSPSGQISLVQTDKTIMNNFTYDPTSGKLTNFRFEVVGLAAPNQRDYTITYDANGRLSSVTFIPFP
jgi:hypothetical protein